MGSAEFLVDELAKIDLANVFNPYSEICPHHDKPDAPLIRQRNLRLVLEAGLTNGTRTVWVGRDLGHLGGRRTGLALVDEVRLAPLAKRLGVQGLVKATHTPTVREATAANIWAMVDQLSEVPVFWNAFPLHPHEPGFPASNRLHSSAEARATKHFLVALLEMFQPQRVIAIGNDAQEALRKIGQESICVRHPSYGGQFEFRHAIQEVYR